MIKKFYLSASFILLFILPGFASHYMGGEIIWQCLPNGNYRFVVRLYRECAGVTYPTSGITLNSTSPAGDLNLKLYPNQTQGRFDISPVCNDNPTYEHITCPTTTVSNTGGVEEWTYTSDQTYPTGVNLSGVPPSSGWLFYYEDCCRNPSTNIYDTPIPSLGFRLRAIMYPYQGQNVYPCLDNSPEFVEKPLTVICTGYPFTYNPNAFDKELDSLAYEWGQPLNETTGAPITQYNTGYSYQSPLPGPSVNPNNVAATVNSMTGEIAFTSFTQGAFVTVTKVTAFRCGIKIAEIFREMQVVLLTCGYNDPPTVTIQDAITGDTLNILIDTVYAGELVNFFITAIDTNYQNDPTQGMQMITFTATGSQFGQDYINPDVGCLQPPCAVLDQELPSSGYIFTSVNFSWQTVCEHLVAPTGCGGITNVFNFIIKCTDDYCPAPGIKVATITIVLKNPIMPPPKPRCTTTDVDGSIKLEWTMPDTTEVPDSWNAYMIYRSTNLNGPYTLIDSLKLENGYASCSTSYNDMTAHGNDTVYYYYMQTRSGCFGSWYSANSDTISNILLNSSNAGNDLAFNQWNAPSTPLPPSSTGVYTIYRKANNMWVPVSTTTNTSDYVPVTGCGYMEFMVWLEDSSGCVSRSNIDSALFQSSTPPDLRCISVEDNGDVSVVYIPPTGSLDFFSAYLVYSATTPAGPFTLIDSVNVASQTSTTITALNANPFPVYVYMTNRIDCDGFFNSQPSDTLSSIFLSITSIDENHSQLSWNETHQPPLPSSTGVYNIYRNYPVGYWDTLGYTPLLSAYDSLYICDDTIPYRIKIRDDIGCYSTSNIAKVRYNDPYPPPIPAMDTASIDTLTGFTHISWIANDAETQGYILFYNDNGTWTTLDTIWGNLQNHYLDRLSPGNGCDAPKSYVIAAFDSCWNTSPMSLSDMQNTLHLQIDGIDPCQSEISLSWNPYQNMKDYLAGYKVFVSGNGSPPYLLGTVTPAGPGLPVPTSFVHQNYTEGSYYCYHVQAYNSDGLKTSTSCKSCILATKPKQPKFLYNRVASVEPNNRIKIRFMVDTSAYVTEYKVLRSGVKTGPYEIAGHLYPSLSPDMIFTDNNVNPMDASYYYYIAVVDSCGNEVLFSDTSRTVLLTVEAREDFTNHLEWNAYEGWNWSYVKSYNIFRGIDGLNDPIPIATVPGDTLKFTDDVSTYFETQGKFRYYIEALEGLGSLPFTDTTYSNRANDIQNSKIFIPNAFSPKGYNSVFKPISIYADKTNYTFKIYNRWGELLFSTNDPDEGWNGTYEGDYVPMGVYIYFIKFNTSEGKKFEKRSTVTVIK